MVLSSCYTVKNMYQFFVNANQIEGTHIYIDGSDMNHIKNVLRMKIGEELNVVTDCDDKEYRCEIESFDEDRVNLTVQFIKESNVELPNRIFLLQGLPKGDKLELIIQKSVELGVFSIIPVSLKRSVVKLDAKKAKSKTERWQAISEAAAKQSKRRIIPKISEPKTLKEALEMCKDAEVKIVPYELCDFDTMSKTRELLSGIKPGEDIAILIGPEGGFDKREIEDAKNVGFDEITLGHRILRTETAPITLLSWLVYLLEQ